MRLFKKHLFLCTFFLNISSALNVLLKKGDFPTLPLDLCPCSTLAKQGGGGGHNDRTASPRTREIISTGQFHPVIMVVDTSLMGPILIAQV